MQLFSFILYTGYQRNKPCDIEVWTRQSPGIQLPFRLNKIYFCLYIFVGLFTQNLSYQPECKHCLSFSHNCLSNTKIPWNNDGIFHPISNPIKIPWEKKVLLDKLSHHC